MSAGLLQYDLLSLGIENLKTLRWKILKTTKLAIKA